MDSQMTPSHLTLSNPEKSKSRSIKVKVKVSQGLTLKSQSQGHSDLEALYLAKE